MQFMHFTSPLYIINCLWLYSIWSSPDNGLPHHVGSASAMEALRQHRQWLMNFQHDIHLINLTARHQSRHTAQHVVNGLYSDDHQYPLFVLDIRVLLRLQQQNYYYYYYYYYYNDGDDD